MRQLFLVSKCTYDAYNLSTRLNASTLKFSYMLNFPPPHKLGLNPPLQHPPFKVLLKTYENHLLLDTVSSKIAHIRLDMEQTNSNATNVATNIKQTLRMDDNDNNSQYILLKCYVSSQKVIFQYFIYKSSTLHSNTHGLADTF